MRKLLALWLSAALLLTMLLPVSATEVDEEGDIIYTDGVEKFIFLTDSEYTDTDQFHNFKTVMPGDTIEQHILLRNDMSDEHKIKVYMRALGAHEESSGFLSQLKLTVVKDTDTVLFEASADQAAQLTDWVYLGTLYAGGVCQLTVTLEVPVTLGNEYANAIGYLDWEFGVSEHPVEDTDPRPPQTGDESKPLLWAGMAVTSLFLLILLPLRRRKEENV